MITVYISIGNSDDRLTQREWAAFVLQVHLVLIDAAKVVHGSWTSASAQEWQNACWCAEIPDDRVDELKDRLRYWARQFRQDSIAWAEAPETEFLCAG